MIHSISWILCSAISQSSASIDNGCDWDEEIEQEEKDKEEGDDGCRIGEEEVEDKDKEVEGERLSWNSSILRKNLGTFNNSMLCQQV